MDRVLITGASRGIGRELVEQFAALGWEVYAALRTPMGTPFPPGVVPLELDLKDPASPARMSKALKGKPLDLLWNNAGLYGLGASRIGEIDPQEWQEVLTVNSLGPLLVTQALLPNLKLGQKKWVVATSSTMGSIGENTSGGSYAYRASKAALNSTVKSLAQDLGPSGFTCVAFCPGWVKTVMGGTSAPLEAKTSVAGLIQQCLSLTRRDNGRFLNWQGREIPW